VKATAVLLLVGVLALVAGARPGRAQSRPGETLAPTNFDPVALEKDYRRAQARRNTGIAVAVPGVASTILGGVLLGYSVPPALGYTHVGERNLGSAQAELGAGLVLEAAGLVLGVLGTVLWIGGQDAMDVVKWRRRQLVAPFAAVQKNSGAAGVAVTF
jgi:hypothetical protein